MTWRQRLYDKIDYVMGGKCFLCGYDKCRQALELHHIDPSLKDIDFNKMITNNRSLQFVHKELQKCVLLCANCHREYHYGVLGNIKFVTSFSEQRYTELMVRECKECKKPIYHLSNIFCSKKCSGIFYRRQQDIKADKRRLASIWYNIDVVNLISRNNGVFTKAAKEIGISDNGVRRRFRKITGYKSWREHLESLPKKALPTVGTIL